MNQERRRPVMRWVLTIAAGFLVAARMSALALTEQDALEERCGKRAEDVFRRDWGKDANKTGTRATYRHYYNTRLKRCFYLLTTTSPTITRQTLSDLDMSMDYGVFSRTGADANCTMFGKPCITKDWEGLIRPYMED